MGIYIYICICIYICQIEDLPELFGEATPRPDAIRSSIPQ